MYKKTILIITTLLIYTLICKSIYTAYNYKNHKTIKTTIQTKINNGKKIEKEKPIGKIIIKSINIEQELYDKTSKHNNIEENITILNQSIEPNKNNSIMFIAAHSGTGKIAYFEKLNNLKIDEEIKLIYKNKIYIYKVKNIMEQKKTGTIRINKENKKQLVLTTCSPNKDNYQLIINCIITKELPM